MIRKTGFLLLLLFYCMSVFRSVLVFFMLQDVKSGGQDKRDRMFGVLLYVCMKICLFALQMSGSRVVGMIRDQTNAFGFYCMWLLRFILLRSLFGYLSSVVRISLFHVFTLNIVLGRLVLL